MDVDLTPHGESQAVSADPLASGMGSSLRISGEAEKQSIVWGTDIVITDTMRAVREFIVNFDMKSENISVQLESAPQTVRFDSCRFVGRETSSRIRSGDRIICASSMNKWPMTAILSPSTASTFTPLIRSYTSRSSRTRPNYSVSSSLHLSSPYPTSGAWIYQRPASPLTILYFAPTLRAGGSYFTQAMTLRNAMLYETEFQKDESVTPPPSNLTALPATPFFLRNFADGFVFYIFGSPQPQDTHRGLGVVGRACAGQSGRGCCSCWSLSWAWHTRGVFSFMPSLEIIWRTPTVVRMQVQFFHLRELRPMRSLKPEGQAPFSHRLFCVPTQAHLSHPSLLY